MAALIFLLTTGWETVVQKRLARRQKVLILGGAGVASDLAAEADRDCDSRLDVVGLVADNTEGHDQELPLLGSLAELGEVVEAHQPDLIVLANADPGRAVDRLLEISWRKFRVVGVSYSHHRIRARCCAHDNASLDGAQQTSSTSVVRVLAEHFDAARHAKRAAFARRPNVVQRADGPRQQRVCHSRTSTLFSRSATDAMSARVERSSTPSWWTRTRNRTPKRSRAYCTASCSSSSPRGEGAIRRHAS